MAMEPFIIYTDGADRVFRSPDGIGRHWYDSVAEAVADTGEPVVHISRRLAAEYAEDWDSPDYFDLTDDDDDEEEI